MVFHAISLDGILATKGSPVASAQPVTAGIAAQISQLEIGRALELEIEFRAQDIDSDEGFREWARFFWTLHRAGRASQILSRDDVREILQDKVVDQNVAA